MEEIIYLLLFTYPGALSMWLDKQLWPRKDIQTSSLQETGACFFASCIIMALSIAVYMAVFAPEIAGLSELLHNLLADWNILWYAFITCPAILLYVWLRHSLVAKRDAELLETGSTTTWHDLCADAARDDLFTDSIVVVYKNGMQRAAGIPYLLPSDVDSSPGIVLLYQDFVETVLKDDAECEASERYIGDEIISYYDPARDIRYAFYRAEKLMDYCDDFDRSRKGLGGAGLEGDAEGRLNGRTD